MPDTIMTWQSIAPAIPEIYLVAAIGLILLVDAFAGQAHRGLTPTLTLIALAAGAALTVAYGNVPERTILFDGMYVADQLAYVLKLSGFLFVAFGLLYSRDYLEERGILRGEYYVLTLTALLGIFVLVSANSMLTAYIGVELLALSVYAMAAFDRDSGVAAESAMKYFVLGAIGSGTLLYGMSMLYGMTGTVEVRRSLGISDTELKRVGSPQGTFVRNKAGWRRVEKEASRLKGGSGSAIRAEQHARPGKLGTGGGDGSEDGPPRDPRPAAQCGRVAGLGLGDVHGQDRDADRGLATGGRADPGCGRDRGGTDGDARRLRGGGADPEHDPGGHPRREPE